MKNRPTIDYLMRFIVVVLMVRKIHGGCIEEEREALLEIKASLMSYGGDADRLLPTWTDHGGDECCDWERVKCNSTTGQVTDLALEDLREIVYEDYSQKIWELNVSVFLHFKELRSLNLASDFLDSGIEKTGVGRLSSLKKLEMLNLSRNYIENNSIFRSLGALTSLRVLDLSNNYMEGQFPAHELAALENLEILDLTYSGGLYGTFEMQGLERLPGLRKLKILNLGYNSFNESILPSLSALPSLKVLNLMGNSFLGSFPAKELVNLNNLEKLDLSENYLNDTSSIEDCKKLSSLKKLESIVLGSNMFNKSIISCLSSLPSLKILDLQRSTRLGNSFPAQELSTLKKLTTLDLSSSRLDSLEFNGTISSLMHLNLDWNNFRKDFLRSLVAFPSLKSLSLANCYMEGMITTEDLPKLPDLEVLILRNNWFNGTLPMKGLTSFPRLEVLDLSNNIFVGSIPSLIQALPSLKVLSLAQNDLNGSLPLQGFCAMKNLTELDLSQNKFEGDLPPCFNSLSSLKLFDLSLNQFTGKIPSSLISNLTSLEYLDLSHNKFEGLFSMTSFFNHTKLEVLEFISDNDKFEVETEEDPDWIPKFQLKVLVLSNCKLNKISRTVPSFLLHQNKLQIIDLSHNSLNETFPKWLIENNPRLEYINLRRNSLYGTISMPPYRNVNTWWLDMSGNHLTGGIPPEIGNILPYITNLNLSRNSLEGSLPLSISDLIQIQMMDLSNNNFSGKVPSRLVTDCPSLTVLQLSNNKFDGEILSRKFNTSRLSILLLDNNRFTGVITDEIAEGIMLNMLDISGNLFSGVIPGWISNLTSMNALVIRNNKFQGQFPCGEAPFLFLDISQNSFSGKIPSCLNLKDIKHLHLDSNGFTGSVPESFRNLTNLLTLDMGNNKLSGKIPNFLGEISSLRILFLRKNNFTGSIPKELCQLSNVSLLDLSGNSLSGSIPNCLQNITGPTHLAFQEATTVSSYRNSFYSYASVLVRDFTIHGQDDIYEKQDEVQFITKSRPDTYKGGILDYMSGLDLSSNNLTGEIPQEFGLLTHIRALNLSHNQLIGSIPSLFSNLANIESLDISSNSLSGRVPSELIGLNYLAVFSVANNNLSGRLPEMKGQFGTFTGNSYEGNPFLCGLPLEKSCSPVKTNSTLMTPADENEEEWYDVDLVFFGASLVSTWFVLLMGFVGVLYVNPDWRMRWFAFVEKCMYFCYYFVCDSLRKPRLW